VRRERVGVDLGSWEVGELASYDEPLRISPHVSFRRLVEVVNRRIDAYATGESLPWERRGLRTTSEVRLVQRLPARQRVAFLLFAVGYMRVGKIASVLHTTEGAVKLLLFRARASIQKHSKPDS